MIVEIEPPFNSFYLDYKKIFVIVVVFLSHFSRCLLLLMTSHLYAGVVADDVADFAINNVTVLLLSSFFLSFSLSQLQRSR